MAYPNVAPYGSWKSPITADVVAAGEVGLEQVRLDGDEVYWIERRSQEGGRKIIVRRSPDGQVADITPVGFNARTRVHEYGGGDYAVSNGMIIFSNFTDQRLYVQNPGLEPRPLTPAADMRYADGVIDRQRRSFFLRARGPYRSRGSDQYPGEHQRQDRKRRKDTGLRK